MGLLYRLFLVGGGFYTGLFLRDSDTDFNKKTVKNAQQVSETIKEFVRGLNPK